MLHVAIVCAKRTSFQQPDCPDNGQILWDLPDPDLDHHALLKVLGEHGWVEEDGEYYCPRHWPADAGIMWDPPMADGEYHPIANTGWEARSLLASHRLEIRPIRSEGAAQ